MIKRFQGLGGRRALIDALMRNEIVGGDGKLATGFADSGELIKLDIGQSLIHEGEGDNSVYFILSGKFSVLVKGNKIADRSVGETVGETSAIDPTQKRSATLVATEDSVVLSVEAEKFIEIADDVPSLWRTIAVGLSRRLVERNALVNPVNEQVNIFVICSVEALGIAQEIQSGLSHENVLVTLWTNGVFIASQYALESLEDALQQSDFAVAVAHPDDQTVTRGESSRTPRDNVIFELGFFMGKLGRDRTFLVEPRGEGIKLPSDLKGINPIGYRPGPPEKLAALLGPACTEIRKIVSAKGPKR